MESKGIVGSVIAGVGALILVVIVTLVIISTITDSNLLRSTAATTTVPSETIALNASGNVLAEFNSSYRSYAIVQVLNATGGDKTLNYTFNSATGVLKNTTIGVMSSVNVTYTYIKDTIYEQETDDFGNRFIVGIDNVSGKVPTILLIAIIVILLGVLVLLINRAREAGFGSTGGSL